MDRLFRNESSRTTAFTGGLEQGIELPAARAPAGYSDRQRLCVVANPSAWEWTRTAPRGSNPVPVHRRRSSSPFSFSPAHPDAFCSTRVTSSTSSSRRQRGCDDSAQREADSIRFVGGIQPGDQSVDWGTSEFPAVASWSDQGAATDHARFADSNHSGRGLSALLPDSRGRARVC